MVFTVNKDMKTKFQKAFMQCAHTFAKLSHPCPDCAKIIHQSGISHVYYDVDYVARKGSGKEFMIKSHIEVIQVCV